MDIKLSISILISSAYFLTLLIFKILNTGELIRSLSEAGIYSLVIFAIIYTLILYINFSLEGLKKQETKNTLEHIKRLEAKYREQERVELDKKFKALQEKETEKENKVMDNLDLKKFEFDNKEEKEQSPQDIEKLKQDSGTQFDPNYIKKYDIPQI